MRIRYKRHKKQKYNDSGLLMLGILIYYWYYYHSKLSEYAKLIIVISAIIILGRFIYKIISQYKKKMKYLNSGIQDVDKMSGIEFENFLKVHYQKLGYAAETTAVTGDYGADLILRKNNEKIVAQAKRYNAKVGIKAIQEIIGAKGFYKANKGIVVTNSYFTPNAKNLAIANNIELWDREKLIEVMINENAKENINATNQEFINNIDKNTCPWCGEALVEKNGKYGRFLGCSNYPKCRYTREIKINQ